MGGVLIVGLALLGLGAVGAFKGRVVNGVIFGTFGAAICLVWGLLAGAGVEFVATPAKTDEVCRAEFDCWSNKFHASAAKGCAPLVEGLALLNYRWTDSLTSPKFPRAAVSENGGKIAYIGDAIEFQNSLGAWIVHTYTCHFDTELNAAISVDAHPGRL